MIKMTRIFFSADVHGSELCYRKFVNAGKVYKCDVVILGGDLTGKMIVPIIEQRDGTYYAHYLGEDHILKTEEDVRKFESLVADNGYYTIRVTEEEHEKISSDPEKIKELFSKLVIERLEHWINMAEEHLKNTGIRFYMLPGNDDSLEVDEVIEKSDYVVNPEGKVIELDSYHELISTGYSNITPWNCPRDIPEEELAKKIEDMIVQVKNIKNCIFNFHCPPYATTLDLAPKLDENLRPKLTPGGDLEYTHVGSTAVREAIEKYQPLLGLHGHIHESRGVFKIGRTLCINPGSEYAQGVLRGVIVQLSKGKIKGYLLTSG